LVAARYRRVVPDERQARALLAQAGCGAGIVSHVEAVARLANAMAHRVSTANAAVILAGAWLHDIGRAFESGPAHVPTGVAWLEGQDVDERVVRCVARHMGAGITDDEARRLGWPAGSYVPETLEERIVCHADNLTFGTRHVDLAEVRAKFERHAVPGAIERLERLHKGLARDLGIDPDDLVRTLDA